MTICIIISQRKKKLAKVSNVSRQCPRHWRILPATISKRPRLSAKRLVKTCVLKGVPEIAGTTYMPTKQYAQLLNIRCLLPNWIFIIIAIIIYRHSYISYTLRVNTCPVFILVHCQFAKLRQIKWNETILRFLLKKLTQPLGKPSAAVPILPYLVGYAKRTNHVTTTQVSPWYTLVIFLYYAFIGKLEKTSKIPSLRYFIICNCWTWIIS